MIDVIAAEFADRTALAGGEVAVVFACPQGFARLRPRCVTRGPLLLGPLFAADRRLHLLLTSGFGFFA